MRSLIAERLIQLRGKRRQVDVANSVGVSVSAIKMYEQGRRTPRDDIKIRLASYYGVSVQQLFFENKRHISCSA